jgi:hypothetical protein
MSWFSARLLLRCDTYVGRRKLARPLYEELIVVVRAENEAEAKAKAIAAAKKGAIDYKTASGAMAKWRLAGVIDLLDLDEDSLDDGTEVGWRFFRNISAYRRI